MFLADWEIDNCIKSKEIIIDPYDSSLLNPCSLNFRLGGTVAEVKASGTRPTTLERSFGLHKTFIDPKDPSSFTTETFQIPLLGFILDPGKFILAGMLEHITLADNILSQIVGRSSLGRIGLGNSEVSGLIDPSFKGGITLELFNHSQEPLLLTAGMSIGQMCFQRIQTPKIPYSKKKNSKYYNQRAGQPSLGVD